MAKLQTTRDLILGHRISPRLRQKLDDRAVLGYREGQYDFYTLSRLLAIPVGDVKSFLIQWEQSHGVSRKER